MSKMYVKDPNGKYKLVDKETLQGPRTLSLEDLDLRLRMVESILIGPPKK